MIARIFYGFFSVTLLYFLVSVANASSIEVHVSAQSAVLMNADTGAILYEKNAHQKAYPASITKIATALYVLEKGVDLTKLVRVSQESLQSKPRRSDWETLPSYWLEWDGKKMGLLRGEQLSLKDLLHGTLLVSGNDAANVLAESVSGSISSFMYELNQYLSDLGCHNTVFKNPHGLSHKEHYTTALDMALIAQRALQVPAFKEITAKLEYMKPRTNKQPAEVLKQSNQLLKSKSRFFYPKAIGIKTGYTKLAQHTLVAAACDQGRTLIAVLLGCETREGRYLDAKRLFEAAFSEKKMRRLFFEKNQSYSREILGAKTPLIGSLAKDAAVEFYPAEEPNIRAFLRWESLSLPIAKGEKVGEMHFCDEKQRSLFSVPLLAKQEVRPTLMYALKEWLRRLVSVKEQSNHREIDPPGADAIEALQAQS